MAGQSMMPLLNSGDVVLVNRLIYDFAKPNRLDVVVFEREDKKTNVKRVIGLPGDVDHASSGGRLCRRVSSCPQGVKVMC